MGTCQSKWSRLNNAELVQDAAWTSVLKGACYCALRMHVPGITLLIYMWHHLELKIACFKWQWFGEH